MNKTDLHNYQKRAINFALNRPYCALYIDMGLGKTIVTLTLIKRLLEVLETGKTFITAPKRVCYKTWPDEVKKWDHVNDLDYQVIKALSQKHKKGGREKTRWDADIHIVNREIVPWWVNVWEKEKWPYDTVVMDESSSFKQYNGKRFKALKSVRHRMDRVIQLTGTPTSTSLLDLWAQIYMLDCGARLGPTYSYFKQRYFMPIDYEQRHWVPKPGAKDKIYEILSDICLTMRTEDYLDLPGSIDNIIKVDLPSSLHDKYRELEREFIFHMDETKIRVNYAAECRMKLMQFCNGAIYTDKSTSENRPWLEVHNEKLDALDSVFEEAAGNQVLVGYKFKSDAIRIKKRFKDKVEIFNSDDETIEDRWNRGEVGNLICHPQQMGHGTNIQFGGHHLCWFGMPDSLELYQQFNRRLTNRQGQTRVVVQHHILVENTVDMTIARNLKAHSLTQLELLNFMKEDIRERM